MQETKNLSIDADSITDIFVSTGAKKGSDSRLSGNLPDCPEIFQTVQNVHTVQKFSRLSGNIQDFLELFKTVRKSSRLFMNHPDSPEHIPDCKEIFQTVQKFSRLSGNIPDSPEIFQAVLIHLRLSGNPPDCR